LVTGAAGQIGYSIVPMICSGEFLGPKQPVILHMLDIAPMQDKLNGVKMEIDDCAFPLVKGSYQSNFDFSPSVVVQSCSDMSIFDF
jgi:malate/lactate dehydrogenase